MHRRILSCLVAAFGSFAVDRTASAGTLYVDANLATGANDGSSWVDAFQGLVGLQSALAVAVAGDEIWVADGMYKPTATLDRTISFDMKSGVAILGGFAGGETLASQADPETNVAILTGDLDGNDDYFGGYPMGENSQHVVRGAGADATAILDGFTIQSGQAIGSPGSDPSYGGGLFMVGASNGTIRRCTLRNNLSVFGAGGAGHIRGSQPTFTDCRFIENWSTGWGGAIDMRGNGDAVFERCVFDFNHSDNGGAVHVHHSSPRFSNCLFTRNGASNNNDVAGVNGGGAILVNASTLWIHNCTITRNSASKGGTGGGILASTSLVDVSNSIVYRNWAYPVGGQGTPSDIAGQLVSARYSCIDGGYPGPGNTSGPPMFVNNTYFGLPDFRLQVGSPCIDAGDNATVPVGVVRDLDGALRFVDHPAADNVGPSIRPPVDMGAYETQEPISSYCFGDSLAGQCPCSTESYRGGCSNSLGVGGVLSWSGVSSLSSDSVVLAASNFTGGSALFVQGTRLAQIQISNGVWCVNGSILRLGVVPAAFGIATFPTSLSVAGGVIAPGVYFYQVSYRDAVGVCASASTNYTNGVAVIWSP